MRKLLIANRGEIARRIIRTAHRMGIETVAVYSEADADAPHVHEAGQAVLIGPAPASESYLLVDRLLDAAARTNADAVHPGYGFLSENAKFALAVRDAGLTFVGPPVKAIDAMGLKDTAKKLMKTAGVPVTPGYQGDDQSLARLEAASKAVGYPLLIKAVAGGGGKGMRRVDDPSEFADALIAAKREGEKSFGNDGVMIEKLILRPRHVEVQVFADRHGNAVHLFERDCSLQRRHQKVIEEAPAPGLSASLREALGAAAVKAATAIGYEGAGTIEFILDCDDVDTTGDPKFYFMEMNTRLQVEHPVTEAITGEDLVEWQLRVASGQPLPKRQDELRIIGHAIEARICAENPDNNFLPATGRLNVYRKPVCTSFERSQVRVDDGVREGDAISPFYDSMIAKLIVHGDTREQALARLDDALAQTHIVGLATNVQFLRHVVQSGAFAQARLDTALIQREEAVLFQQEKVGLPLAAAAAVASQLLRERAGQGANPFSRTDGWRSLTACKRRFEFDFGGQHAKAWLSYERDGSYRLAVGEGEGAVSGALAFALAPGGAMDLQYAGQRTQALVYAQGESDHVFTPRGATRIEALDLLAHAGETAGEGGRLTAPMPGKVVSFAVQAGDKVSKGQALAVMEAMKMEHTIAAPQDGVVAELLYAPGDQVTEGAELLRLSAV